MEPTKTDREWERPELTALGDLATLTAGAVGTNFDGSGQLATA